MDLSYLIEFTITSIALVMLVSIAMAIAKAFSKPSVVGGIVGFAIFILAILLMSKGTIDTPLTNWVSAGIAGLSPASAQASPNVAPPIINNIQVDVPEQPPVTVIVPQQSAGSTLGITNEPVRELNIEIFDLGSVSPAGFFEDGTPYYDNGDGVFYREHIVISGDTVFDICNRQYGITESEFLRLNPEFRISDHLVINHVFKILVKPQE